MASQMMEALELPLPRRRHIDQLYLLDRLEQSLAKSYADMPRPALGAPSVTIDRQTGKVYVYRARAQGRRHGPRRGGPPLRHVRRVRRGRRDPRRTRAASPPSTPRREINAIVRNAARVQIYEEFSERMGEHHHRHGPADHARLHDHQDPRGRRGRAAALRPAPPPRGDATSAPHGECYAAQPAHPRDHHRRARPASRPGRHVRRAASATARAIIVSRTHPDLIRRLFELEVPEVYDGVVEVKARRPRARRALQGRRLLATTPHLDPVGACVGPKGCARAHGRLRAARRAH